MLTGTAPFSQIEGDYPAMMHIITGGLPVYDSATLGTRRSLLEILSERCWAFNPQDRPTSNQLLTDIGEPIPPRSNRMRHLSVTRIHPEPATERLELERKLLANQLVHQIGRMGRIFVVRWTLWWISQSRRAFRSEISHHERNCNTKVGGCLPFVRQTILGS